LNNDKDNKDIQPQFNDPLNWKSLGFFSAEDYLLYIFKKTEKITAALYLVSGLLKDEEPLKWELRDRGMDLISSSFTASSSIPGDNRNSVIQALFTAALETMSLLNVAKISNLISEMNHQLLIKEIDNIIGMLRDRLVQNAENAGYVLSEAFFKTPSLFTSGFKSDGAGRGMEHRQVDKGQHVSDKIGSARPDGGVKKSQRQDSIIGILKGQSNLTIKDFTKVIKDCSEKTIQRELLDLVDKGVVKREGERRWSRYSLKQS